MRMKGVFGTEFQISSKTLAMIFGGVGALLTAFSLHAIQVPMGIPPAAADYAASWSDFILKIWAVVGPTALVLFTDSTPGPLAPQDPPVVKDATAKAADMGQIAKAALVAAIFIIGLASFDGAHAATPHHRGLNCGLPHPDAGCHAAAVTPAAATTTAGLCAPADLSCVINALMNVKTEFVTILQEVDTDQASVINPATGESWDPLLHICLMGSPASGTAGQPGYVAEQPGLVSWIQGLTPPTMAAVPPVVDQNNLAEVAEHVRLVVLAGEQDVNVLVSNLQAGGVPVGVKQPCAGFLQDAFITQPANIAGQWATINGLLLKYLPAAIKLKKLKAGGQ